MEKSIKAGATLKLPSNLSIEKMKEYKEQFEKVILKDLMVL